MKRYILAVALAVLLAAPMLAFHPVALTAGR